MIQDPSIEEDTALDRLNEGLLTIAGTVLLPGLEDVGQVTTVVDDHLVDLPDNYHRGLFKAQDHVDGRPIGVLKSKSQMMERYFDLNRTGKVYDVCVAHGNKLMYQHVPDEPQVITIFYYRAPNVITEDTEPDGFNHQCRIIGEEALYYYACWKLFEAIEDGIEGRKVNTEYFKGQFLELVENLRLKVSRDGASRPAPPVVRGCFR